MARAAVGGHELAYERAGSGPPLLLVMGLSGTRLTWGEPFLAALRRDFDVVAYDHRGMGCSSRARLPFTIGDLAADAAGLLEALRWEAAHVVGISMGGMVAQELVLAHPERVRSLVLGCTYAGGPGEALTPPEVIQGLVEAMRAGDAPRVLRVLWGANVSEAYAAQAGAWEAFARDAAAARAPRPVVMAQLRASAVHDAAARLGAIAAPTLVVHGTEDRMLPVANARLIAAAIPGARLELLEGVGHLFFREQPERSARLIGEHALGR